MTSIFVDFDSISLFGVVPVFVNTGAALLPATLAGAASVLGLLFKPRELFRLCLLKPWVTVLVIALAVGGYFLISWLLGLADTTAAAELRRRPDARAGDDWAAVALELIQQEERDLRKTVDQERQRHFALEARVKQLEEKLNAPGGQPDASPRQERPPEATIYRGGPARCGYGGGGSPLKLKPFWEYNDDFTMYLASPLVVGDAVYAASCVLDPPSNYGAVFCLDAVTGEERWYTDVFDDPKTGRERELKALFSSPALTADGKHLLIGQGLHTDDDCELLCLDAKTGAVRWVVPTNLHIEGSPAIEGDIVVAGAGAVEGEDLKPKGDPGCVFAVRISNGDLLWEYPLGDPESSPVVRDGIAYIGSGIGGSAVVALRTASKEDLKARDLDRLVWKTETARSFSGRSAPTARPACSTKETENTPATR